MFTIRATAVLLLCACVALAQSGAVLSATGRVLVNHLEARSAALASGDEVLTGDEAFASITEPGSHLVLGKNTSSTLNLHKLVLHQGNASVTTTSSYAVAAGSFTITPAVPSTQYDVRRAACRITIVAHDAALKLSDGTSVKPGQSVTRVEPNCADGGSSDQTAAHTAPSHDRIVVGGMIVGGSTLAAFLTSGEPQASPSRPHR